MIHDISPPLSGGLAVWPGDIPLSRDISSSIEAGDRVTLSSFRTTAHLGAHADAPCHYGAGGESIDRCDLECFLGTCQVIRVPAEPGGRVRREQLPPLLEAPRVLIATGTRPDPTVFNEDFAGLDPGLVDALAADGVRLVGIDTPSVDVFRDEDLAAHAACFRHGLAILEGLDLVGVAAGIYELIALPLKLVGFDGSPVRAVLRSQ